MNTLTMLRIDLTLFDGAAASGAGAGGTAGAADGGAQGDNTSAGSTRQSSGEQKVLYGKQNIATANGTVTDATDNSQAAAGKDTDVVVTSNTLDDKRKAFQDLINGEYKDIYTEETQRIINRRFKETATLKSQVEQFQPIADMLMSKYGIKNGDMKKLADAIDNDDMYWTEAADEAGMSVEQYKAFQKLQRENERLLRAEDARKGEQYVKEQTAQWYKEADELKKQFPNFDFITELKDPNFVRMLQAKTPMEHAYKVIHFDELMNSAIQRTAVTTQKAVVDNVRARGARPQENGTVAQSAFTVKDDVSKLTKKDRADIVRLVARGEMISF